MEVSHPPRFRVWCRDKNEWESDPVYLDRHGDLIHGERRFVMGKDNHVFQLCTGLTDAIGRYVFEGDIVDQGDSYDSIVRFGVGGSEEWTGFYLEELDPDKRFDSPLTHGIFSWTTVPDEWKIIGNIFDTDYIPTPKEKDERPEVSRFDRLEMTDAKNNMS